SLILGKNVSSDQWSGVAQQVLYPQVTAPRSRMMVLRPNQPTVLCHLLPVSCNDDGSEMTFTGYHSLALEAYEFAGFFPGIDINFSAKIDSKKRCFNGCLFKGVEPADKMDINVAVSFCLYLLAGASKLRTRLHERTRKAAAARSLCRVKSSSTAAEKAALRAAALRLQRGRTCAAPPAALHLPRWSSSAPHAAAPRPPSGASRAASPMQIRTPPCVSHAGAALLRPPPPRPLAAAMPHPRSSAPPPAGRRRRAMPVRKKLNPACPCLREVAARLFAVDSTTAKEARV
ncbi:hypothetical protein EJB05_40331, partial [Eragrostis curvula]